MNIGGAVAVMTFNVAVNVKSGVGTAVSEIFFPGSVAAISVNFAIGVAGEVLPRP